jgi:hypothetical protein
MQVSYHARSAFHPAFELPCLSPGNAKKSRGSELRLDSKRFFNTEKVPQKMILVVMKMRHLYNC